MEIITLSQEERKKFAAYLRQEADTNTGITAQMDKLGVVKAMSTAMQVKTAAFILTAAHLSSIEEMEL